MVDSRRVIDYSELWNGASTSSVVNSSQNGSSHTKQKTSPSSTKVNNNGWSNDGIPQTASSARKLRKILTKIEAGDLESAEIDLSKMGPAKNNYEIQRALAVAKTGVASNGLREEEEYYDEYEEEEDEDGSRQADTDMNGVGFNWQGAMGSNGKDAGRQLTHAEIWDDSALVDAWNAAEEEYKLFHAQRSAHEADKQQDGANRLSRDGIDCGPPKKRSALWYDSPAKGSPVALASKSAQEEQDRTSAELAERKKQAKALLARVAREEDIQPDDREQIQEVASAPANATANGTSTRKKLKGTTPPSSSISGNLAWHSACATVSRTPNAIGADAETACAAIAKHPAPTSSTAPTAEGEDVFQNLAMAWYYAGYYQAMAMNWSGDRKVQ